MVDLPFITEEDLDGEVREFLIERDDEEYVWHRDNEHREIEVLEGEGWPAFAFEYFNLTMFIISMPNVFLIVSLNKELTNFSV